MSFAGSLYILRFVDLIPLCELEFLTFASGFLFFVVFQSPILFDAQTCMLQRRRHNEFGNQDYEVNIK